MPRGTYEKKSYLQASRGKWRERSTEDNPNSTKRIVKRDDAPDKVIHEIVDDFVTGTLRVIEVKEHEEYGKSFNLTVTDEQEIMILVFKYDSGYAFSFLKRIFNCDLEKPITFIPYYFEEDRRTLLVLKQGDEKIESFFSKDTPGGMPSLSEEERTDKDAVAIWKINALKWLWNEVQEKILPNLESLEVGLPASDIQPPPLSEEDAPPPIDETDDLPF